MAASSDAAPAASAKDALLQRVGSVPRDALGWLYACRGLYQLREFHLVIDGLRHCLRHEKTRKQAQHLLAFSLLHTEQPEAAAAAFAASVKLANDTDWQMLVELCIEFPSLSLATPQPAQQPAHAPEEPV